MDKHAHAKSTSKNRVLKLLPKVMTSAFTFQSPPPFSPGKDRMKTASSLSAAGPLAPLVPVDCRRKNKNGGGGHDSRGEPTSPKVSCMGQVKHSNRDCNKNNYGNNNANDDNHHDNTVHRSSSSSTAKGAEPMPPRKSCKTQPAQPSPSLPLESEESAMTTATPTKQHHFSTIRRMFRSGKDPGRMSSSSADQAIVGRPPALHQMKRFASGRDAFANFDWTAQVAPVKSGHRNTHSGGKTSSENDGRERGREQERRRDLRFVNSSATGVLKLEQGT